MCATGFANIWHYPPQCKIGLEFNRNILHQRAIYHIQHWNPQMKFAVWNPQATPHARKLNNSEKTEHFVSMNRGSPEYQP